MSAYNPSAKKLHGSSNHPDFLFAFRSLRVLPSSMWVRRVISCHLEATMLDFLVVASSWLEGMIVRLGTTNYNTPCLQTLPVAIHHHNFRPLPKTLSFRASSSCFFSSCHFDLSRKSSFQQKKHTVLETKKPFALHCQPCFHVDVSKNRGTPKSSILIGLSIINHPFGNTHVLTFTAKSLGERFGALG